MALIETRALAKAYRLGESDVQALRGVTVAIAAGEFVAVMGPSGSGKTTFMNLLGGLDAASSGEYLLDGRSVSGMSSDRLAAIRNRFIGFVFQSFNLLARTTALENVQLPLLYSGMPAAERRQRAHEALERVGLADRAHHRPSQLSGGQQQRVAIARALVNHPKLILADEPTGALDSRTSLEIMSVFQQINDQGITVVVVTHEPEVARFARRLLRFRDGLLVEDEINPDPSSAAALLATGA
jgi:putative ABC transport system ATP-binding protein